ncbi:MAG: class I SAM-dependent methyltransferase [Alphaproteobacteria bacterium]|nr:class I SAM-dependent methyltransferase [Alphaproteobacteria bacterium]
MTADHVAENRRYWNARAGDWVAHGRRHWAQAEPTWGVWDVPESELRLFPDDLRGLDAVELGCGTAYVSGWMARRGARVTGVDVSHAQLATARALADEHGVALTLIEASAEATPLPDGAVDLVISEYGAVTWCDPHRWVAEAVRLLRPGGRLVFLGNHPLTLVCTPLDGSPVDTRLARPWFALHAVDWRQVPIDPGGVEFNLPTSGWVALFRRLGLRIDDYLEPRPAEGGDDVQFYATADHAQRWPTEQVWKLTKT